MQDRDTPDFRFEQICRAVFSQRIGDFNKMVTLPQDLRKDLAKKFDLRAGEVVDIAKTEAAEKVLFSFTSGRVEAVRMVYDEEGNGWQSYCLSSQCGCRMDCRYCATGALGFCRNLSVDEIISQLLYFHFQGEPIDTVSFMGMGEPLDNPQVLEAIDFITDERFFNVSQRKINVSTVGLIPGLKKLIKRFPQVNIAYSLNSPFKKQRAELMPVENKYSFRAVLDVLDRHIAKNKRKVFLCYILLDEVNDSEKHARALVDLIKDRPNNYLYHVNLINYHTTPEGNFSVSSEEQKQQFTDILRRAGVSVTQRRSLGEEISGACGQLHAGYSGDN